MSVRNWIIVAVALAGLLFFGGQYAFHVAMAPVPKPMVFVPLAEDSEVWRLMQEARAASRADDPRRAAELYTRALAIEPGPSIWARDLHAARGSEYNTLDMPNKAFADFDAALKIGYPAPLSATAIRAYAGRGYAAVGLAQYARAKDDFDVVLKAAPNEVPRSSATLAWRGAAYQGLGDRERAIADYQASLALDPNNAYARDGLKALERP